MSNLQVIIIGISGPTASGKSLLANTIFKELGSKEVVIISEDSYYKDQSFLLLKDRKKINYDHPDAFQHDLLLQHLLLLKSKKSVKIPIYDFKKHVRLKKTRHIRSHHIIVLEGILLFVEKKLRSLMDIRIFMDTPLDICVLRRIKRDMLERRRTIQSIIMQYETTVRPMYLRFIKPNRCYADIIIPRGGSNRIAIEIIKSKIRESLFYFNKNKL